MDKVNLAQKFSLFSEQYSPKIVGEVNDAYVKLVKLQGDFVWHQHADEGRECRYPGPLNACPMIFDPITCPLRTMSCPLALSWKSACARPVTTSG